MGHYPRVLELMQDNDYDKKLKKDNKNKDNKNKNGFRYRRIRIPNKSNGVISPLSSGSQKIQSYVLRNNRTIEDFFVLPTIDNDEQQQQQQQDHNSIALNNATSSSSTTNDDGNHEENTCQPMAKWMTVSFVNCNSIHEIDVQGSVSQHDQTDLVLLGQGWFRSTWKYTTFVDLNSPSTKSSAKNKKKPSPLSSSVVLKTLRIEREFIEEYYELHRRDAVAMERLTFSPYVMDVYGYVPLFADFDV
jgi:hypothetical protein